MSSSAFVLVLAAGAGLLAMWLYARIPSLAPERLWRTGVHFGLALAAILLIPNLMSAQNAFLAVVFLLLPALVYVFLSTLWMLRFAQAAMGLGR